MLNELAVPYVWKHVDDARNLFKLLPDFQSYDKAFLNTVPDIADSFLRFDYYAPHVQSLDVYGNKGQYYGVVGWKLLIWRARERFLLPNLHTLVIQSHGDSHSQDQPFWVGAFASPSLINLSITADETRQSMNISFSAASFVLKLLMAHNSRLEKLGLFPDCSIGIPEEEEEESSLLIFLTGEPFYKYVDGVTSLRHLAGTLAWFEGESLQILGRLPYLETLSFYSVFNEPGAYGDFEVADGMFPSLTGLYLYGLDPWDVERITGLPHLLKNIKSFSLEVNVNAIDDDQDHIEWLTEDLFPFLPHTPRITELKIQLCPREDSETQFYELGESVLARFSGLPLESLFLDNIVFSDTAGNLDLAAMWPYLTQLRMPAHPTSLIWLPRLVTIPQLRHLELRLDLRNEPINVLHGFEQSTLTTLVAGEGSKTCLSAGDIELVAR
ncbi:hypothetical protein FRC07_011803 [Ceratobasidium sp. 392]|nr:hypothetical protein FRC07_011803 [Ceratobasidium sp. 392]